MPVNKENSGKSIEKLLDQLDALDSVPANTKRRQAPRCSFRREAIPVRVFHPGGSTSSRMLSSRNLSAAGIALLSPGFLHIGTKIEVTLRRRVGGEDVVAGQVVSCQHVAGIFHNIGVRFDERIFPRLYLDPGSYDETDLEPPPDVSKLRGRVVYLDDQEMDRLLMTHYVRDTQVELIAVATEREAIDALKHHPSEVFLVDLNLVQSKGEDAIRAARAAGFVGPICVVTAETTPTRLADATAAGAQSLLVKPFDRTKLLGMLGTWVNKLGSGEPIVSTLEGEPEIEAIVKTYVENLHKMAADLQRQFDDAHLEELRKVCSSIKGSAAGFGFAQVSDAARDAIKNLDATYSVAESAQQVQTLIEMCRRATIKQ